MKRLWVTRISCLVGLTAACSIVVIWAGGKNGTTTGLGMTMLFVVAVPLAVAPSALRDARTVTIQAVFGAIAVYLVVGIAFALAANLDANLTGDQYFAQVRSASLSQYVYFSYVTLATLGYGDLTPATAVGRLLAVTETIAGSLYPGDCGQPRCVPNRRPARLAGGRVTETGRFIPTRVMLARGRAATVLGGGVMKGGAA